MRTRPSSGPLKSAIAALTPTSEPTRIQRPRTSSPLRRSDGNGRRPRARPPERRGTSGPRARSRRDEEDGARQHDPGEDEEPRSRRGAAVMPAEREPVGAPRRHRAIRVDLDERARRGRLHEPSPRSANVVPITSERKRPGARSLAGRHDPEQVEPPRAASHCRTSMTTTIGTRSSRARGRGRGRFTYMLAEAEMIWPHDRRRASPQRGDRRPGRALRRRRAGGRADVRARGRRRSGCGGAATSAREPFATAEQKESVVLVPNAPPVGTA